MSRRSIALLLLGPGLIALRAQDDVAKSVQLDEFVISAQALGFSVERFVQQVKDDTTFYHAFLNTKYHPHKLKSALRVRDKEEQETATLYREGHLVRNGPMAELILDVESEDGRLRARDGEMRYLTAAMYDDVFFPKGPYTASNRISVREQELQRGSSLERHKSELKKFMFNPGSEISSVPFIGDKMALFDPSMVPFYDYAIWAGARNGHDCWVFSADAKKDTDEDDTVIKTMDTWFDRETMQVIAREYRLAHASLILDFDISIKVDNAVVDGELVPTYVQYDGQWDIPFKKREMVRFYLEMKDWEIVP
jgi:hypothetical protein